jgi:hypothetical protein
MKNAGYWGIVASAVLLLASWTSPAASQTVDWIRQFGTDKGEWAEAVSADSVGNVYVSGWTSSDLGGQNAGELDAFVSKYDAAGALLWTRQQGTSGYDLSQAVSADGLGNVYISGYTWGDLGGPNGGEYDAFVSKYDELGALEWTRQFGTSASDLSSGVSADGLGNVYVAGSIYGLLDGSYSGDRAFLSKYDEEGELLWTHQLGINNIDNVEAVCADGLGSVYVSGNTAGAGNDAFVAKYDAEGALQWVRESGTQYDDASFAVSSDGRGNVYIAGYTGGDLGGPQAGDWDAFVSKYDAAGNLQWIRQLGSSRCDEALGLSADGQGNVYISGLTIGNMMGGPNPGAYSPDNAFVAKYDAAGTLQWTHQFLTPGFNQGRGVSADGLGNVYLSGVTSGEFGGPIAGWEDAWVARIIDDQFQVPEPSALLLALAALVCLAGWRRRSV